MVSSLSVPLISSPSLLPVIVLSPGCVGSVLPVATLGPVVITFLSVPPVS